MYQFESISTDSGYNLIADTFQERDLIVVGNNTFMVAFSTEGVTGALEFNLVNDALPIILEDNLGNRYDVLVRSSPGRTVESD